MMLIMMMMMMMIRKCSGSVLTAFTWLAIGTEADGRI